MSRTVCPCHWKVAVPGSTPALPAGGGGAGGAPGVGPAHDAGVPPDERVVEYEQALWHRRAAVVLAGIRRPRGDDRDSNLGIVAEEVALDPQQTAGAGRG